MASTILADNGVISGTAGLKESADSSGVLALQTTTAGGVATTAVTIDTSQNVGIGTSSPASFGKLAVNGSLVCIRSANGENEMVKSVFSTGLYPAGVYSFNSFSSNFANWLTFKVTNSVGTTSEAARIDSSGNLLVGASTSAGAFKQQLYLPNLVTGAGILVTNATNNTGGAFAAFQNYVGTIIGQISQATSTTVNYATSSDYRLKDNVQPMTGALSTIAQLKPCTYTWKLDDSAGQGFIAHELAEVCPEAVVGEKDGVDADGNPKYQGIDTSFLVATLTAAIQEQQALITTLTERIAALEGAQA